MIHTLIEHSYTTQESGQRNFMTELEKKTKRNNMRRPKNH